MCAIIFDTAKNLPLKMGFHRDYSHTAVLLLNYFNRNISDENFMAPTQYRNENISLDVGKSLMVSICKR